MDEWEVQSYGNSLFIHLCIVTMFVVHALAMCVSLLQYFSFHAYFVEDMKHTINVR